jgi:hypothetical protein
MTSNQIEVDIDLLTSAWVSRFELKLNTAFHRMQRRMGLTVPSTLALAPEKHIAK